MTGGWKDYLPSNPEEEAAFTDAVRNLCKHFDLKGMRVAPDCTACRADLPSELAAQGIGHVEVFPGQFFAFMLCESCGRIANESEAIQEAVKRRLRRDFVRSGGQAGEA